MNPPFGVWVNEDGLQVHPYEQEIIDLAVRFSERGYSVRHIAFALNARGYVNRQSGPIHPTQVQRWLQRERRMAAGC